MIACFICYFVHVTSASYHCFMWLCVCIFCGYTWRSFVCRSKQSCLVWPTMPSTGSGWGTSVAVWPPKSSTSLQTSRTSQFFFCERKQKRNINMKGIFKCVSRGLDLFLCDASINLYSLFLCNFEIMCYIILLLCYCVRI